MEETQKLQPESTGALQDAGTKPKPSFWRRRPVIVIGTVVLGVLLGLGLRYLAHAFTHESTDDAFLDGDIVSIAPKVAGQAKKVWVTSNQRVKAGELLAEIDPRDLQVALDQRRAAVNAAKANVELLRASLELSRAQVDSAEGTAKQSTAEAAAAQANSDKAKEDLKRAAELFGNHTISPQEYDSAKAAATAAEANLKAAQEKAASNQSKVVEAQAQVEVARKSCDRGEAQAGQAEWDAQAAELNLSYTRITAPESGFVTKKAVETGDYVQVGQKLLALVPEAIFVTANFKETQLQNIRVGQPVKITVDSVGGRVFRGHVESIMAGSGARFSLLPPENAVGNYVKVVQRVPVKIVFDEAVQGRGGDRRDGDAVERVPTGHVLGPGMSVVPSVRVKAYEVSQAVTDVVAGVVAVVVGMGWWVGTGKRS